MPLRFSSNFGSRSRALFIDDPSDDENAYIDLRPAHDPQCADSSPTSVPLLQTAASTLHAHVAHNPLATVAGSCLASPTVHGISNVPPNSSIFRERRRPLHVLSLCAGGLMGIIAHLVRKDFTCHMLSVVDIDTSARSSVTSALMQLSHAFSDHLPPSVAANVHSRLPHDISCISSKHVALLPPVDVLLA
jgi:hypothetical protein